MGLSPKATTFNGDAALSDSARRRALSSTMGAPDTFDALAETAPSSHAPAKLEARSTLNTMETTVLPRRRRQADAEPQTDERPRFEMLEVLGRGGMGEVALVKDNDIRRTVAIKRMLADNRGHDATLRFADEVRAVGQLEHPGIVPVYDVGRDAEGDPYLVMKHVQGVTLETVIEKLRERDAEYVDRFTAEYRGHVFMKILNAIRYAHDQGVIHRDIKPANIMIGPFGEVTVMDWGLAKKIEREKSAEAAPKAPANKTSADGKLLQTLHGALVGTPLYMSPEQAAGKNGELDERSDVYALSILFYELLTLGHPRREATRLQDLIAEIIAKDLDLDELWERALASSTPIEYFHFVRKGLARDPDARYQSVGEMESKLHDILSGKIAVACHVTLTKRLVFGFLHWLDRHPKAFTLMLFLTAVSLVAFGAFRIVALVR